MILEVGKPYKTRGGWKAEVTGFCKTQGYLVKHHNPDNVYHLWHMSNGVFDGLSDGRSDLISEWEEPEENAPQYRKLPDDLLDVTVEIDGEIALLNEIVQGLEFMTSEGRKRSLAYLNSRFGGM